MQQTSRRREVQVGIVTLVAIIGVVGGIIWGKGCGFAVHNRLLTMSFSNASGIDVGSPITLNGVRKGNVTALKAEASQVLITALVDGDVPLHSDAAAQIQMAELTGGKKIEIKPGNSTSPLPASQIIQGTVSGDPAALLSDVGDITGSAKLVIRRVDTSVAALNQLLADGRLQNTLRSTMENLEQTSDAAKGLVYGNRAQLNAAIQDFASTAHELRGIVEKTSPQLDRTLNDASAATADLRHTAHVADSALFTLNALLVHVDTMASEIRKGHGTISTLLYDDKLAVELKETVTAVRALIEQTRKHGFNLNIGLGRKP